MANTSTELQRLAPTKDWVSVPRSRQQAKEEGSDAEEEELHGIGTRAGTIVCDSSYSLPSTNWLKRHFGPPVPMREEEGATEEEALRISLASALPLLREVYAFVSRNKTGHIDWQAIAQSYNAQVSHRSSSVVRLVTQPTAPQVFVIVITRGTSGLTTLRVCLDRALGC